MKIKITYNKYTDSEVIGFKEVTETFLVKKLINGAYLLANGWFVDYKYYKEGDDWEIYKGEKYISLCSKPKIINNQCP